MKKLIFTLGFVASLSFVSFAQEHSANDGHNHGAAATSTAAPVSTAEIKFDKMVEAVENNPFIPMAWQKDHKGMQGTEYITNKDGYALESINEAWVEARNEAVKSAKRLHNAGVTKQLCNRLLEPFMWHTTLVTSTTYSNFFELRCPSYQTKEGLKRTRRDSYYGSCRSHV